MHSILIQLLNAIILLISIQGPPNIFFSPYPSFNILSSIVFVQKWHECSVSFYPPSLQIVEYEDQKMEVNENQLKHLTKRWDSPPHIFFPLPFSSFLHILVFLFLSINYGYSFQFPFMLLHRLESWSEQLEIWYLFANIWRNFSLLSLSSWFHGALSRREARVILQDFGGGNGSFLVRASESYHGKFAVSFV